ncbi:Uncharacterised protein [Bordetella pertussis]|nr:Uncharacterised protein [Bordetella pertussis]
MPARWPTWRCCCRGWPSSSACAAPCRRTIR